MTTVPPPSSVILIEKDADRAENWITRLWRLGSITKNTGFIYPGKYYEPYQGGKVGMIVCNNVTKLKDLHQVIKDHSDACDQLLISTRLSEDEIRPLNDLGGGTHFKFKIFNGSTGNKFGKFEDAMEAEWKVYNAAIAATKATTITTTPANAVESKAPNLVATKPENYDKSSKLKHLITLVDEAVESSASQISVPEMIELLKLITTRSA